MGANVAVEEDGDHNTSTLYNTRVNSLLYHDSVTQEQEPDVDKPLYHHMRPTLSSNTSFENKVSFDTMHMPRFVKNVQTYVLKVSHAEYHYSRTSRTVLVAYDDEGWSMSALKWVIDELMNDGDLVICLWIMDRAEDHSYKNEAAKLLERMAALNEHQKKIEIILEVSIGRASYYITKATTEYEPEMLVVGTDRHHARWGLKELIAPQTMCKYCLEYALVPVIIVNSDYEALSASHSNLGSPLPAMTSAPSVNDLQSRLEELQMLETNTQYHKQYFANRLKTVKVHHKAHRRDSRIGRSLDKFTEAMRLPRSSSRSSSRSKTRNASREASVSRLR
ncbi:BA75_00655T0 [Komagataella pastoris]|uniref:BA75_00655T0 n=1 Tax=Komagataella pastoris TaxID=4922 RepID=A0A1B2J909_PICPA|nr:BA75_00655T0 [Komagataella pastoris]